MVKEFYWKNTQALLGNTTLRVKRPEAFNLHCKHLFLWLVFLYVAVLAEQTFFQLSIAPHYFQSVLIKIRIKCFLKFFLKLFQYLPVKNNLLIS